MERPSRLASADYFLIAAFCVVLFGYAGISGRPLTMHEARLPETSREMLHNHIWLLPTSGERPWLERPPLPHWVVIGAMKLFDRDDAVWVVRLPSALMGLISILCVMWMADRWFGREIGMLSGMVLTTGFEFCQYSRLAEDDIYLAALVSLAAVCFVRANFTSNSDRQYRLVDLITNRPLSIWVFFILMGLTNVTKGPLLGLIIFGMPVGIFLIWESIKQKSSQPLLRFIWLWGWLITLALTVAWPLWAYHKYPDVLENWRYDYLGRMSGSYADITEPWFYYFPTILTALLPWTPACLIGLVVTIRRSNPQDKSAWRFIWCWAIVPLLVLSIPKGKHHHYLIPMIAPWAVLGAIGLREIGRWKPLQRIGSGRLMAIAMIALLVGYSAIQSLFAASSDHTVDDTAFLVRAKSEIPAEVPLFINGKLGPTGNLDFFRVQFYSRQDARLLHNLTFLRDQKITEPVVFVITRARDAAKLATLGTAVIVDQSKLSHDMPTPAGRFTLFRLTFDPNLLRYPAPTQITSLQAMERADGPWCGPKF